MPLVTSAQERTILESCLTQAKRVLDHARARGNELQAAMAAADIDKILDELSHIYKRPSGRPPLK